MKINRHALTALREARGFTKSELSVEAGVSLSYLSELESGHKTGGPKVIRKLAEALKVNIWALVGEREAA